MLPVLPVAPVTRIPGLVMTTSRDVVPGGTNCCATWYRWVPFVKEESHHDDSLTIGRGRRRAGRSGRACAHSGRGIRPVHAARLRRYQHTRDRDPSARFEA